MIGVSLCVGRLTIIFINSLRENLDESRTIYHLMHHKLELLDKITAMSIPMLAPAAQDGRNKQRQQVVREQLSDPFR